MTRRATPKKPLPKRPTITPEKEFAARHLGVMVAGVDEAGRGPIAGPVVAAAVIFDFSKRRPDGLRDSKVLSEKRREALFKRIQSTALTYGVGIATAQEVDLINILEATRLAAIRAVEQLDPPPGALVTDALDIPGLMVPQLPIIKGDAKSSSIAAASILAKVTRDRMMDAYHQQFPEYGWDRNRGYPTEEHYAAIGIHGPTVLHRITFSGVGFFDTALRRSPIHGDLRRRFGGLPAGNVESLDQWRVELEAVRPILPPPDYTDLLSLISPETKTKESQP
ncbi:MAG: ribonuclease HII [Candidatus Sumerlaeia bacterium]|nr:ribonuclease HII [Candidatus Sumerlaeia bacterium]